jgi:hypothetical protein
MAFRKKKGPLRSIRSGLTNAPVALSDSRDASPIFGSAVPSLRDNAGEGQ